MQLHLPLANRKSVLTFVRDAWIPELRLIPDRVSRARAYQQAAAVVRTRAWTLAGMFATVAMVNLAQPVALGIRDRDIVIFGPMLVAVGGLSAWFWIVQSNVRSRMRRAVRAILVRDGVAICVNCGYDLRGIERRACPECGRPRAFEHQVGGAMRSGHSGAGR